MSRTFQSVSQPDLSLTREVSSSRLRAQVLKKKLPTLCHAPASIKPELPQFCLDSPDLATTCHSYLHNTKLIKLWVCHTSSTCHWQHEKQAAE